MHALRRPLCAAALLLAVGCLPEHEPLPPSNSTAPSTLRLGLRLQVETSIAGERVVEIRARYQRASGEQATLPVQPTRVTVRDGATIQQAVVINIGPCNAEAAQQQGDARAGCRFTIELTLKNGAGETLSNAAQEVGPVGGGPIESPTFILSAPSLTLTPVSLTFSARAQQALPAAQTVVVTANNASASLGDIGSFVTTSNGQVWLRAVMDQAAHTVTIQPTTTALAVGTYTAVVGVTSSVDGMKPQSLPVTYQVTQAAVLSVTGAGDGTGSVTSSPAGISCTVTRGSTTGTCSATFTPNASVTLTAAPSGSDVFTGWGGPCSGRGSCVVTVAQSVSVQAAFNVPTPVLQLSPTSLSFTGTSGAASPARQSVSVVNGGGGTLSGVAITSIRYGGSESPWLDATLSGTTISVGASPANLPTGNYTASVVVGSANGGSATLTVTFTVAPQPPILRLSPTSLTFSGVSGAASPARQNVQAVNGGGGTLAGVNIASIKYGGSETPWLDATVSGNTISVGATPTRLGAGNYSATVVVNSATGGDATFTVSFAVAPPPSLRLSPTSLSFSGVSGGANPARQNVSILNGGGGTLAGLAVSSITYPGFPPALWADATLTGTTLSVGATPVKLPPGTYTASIVITSSNGGNATLSVSIAVATPPPILGLSSDTLSFGTIFGSTLPSGKTVRALNIGFGTFADLGPLSVGPTSPWLRVSFDGDIVVVQPNTTTLGRGMFTGTVTINSARGGSATISVTYFITVIG